MERVYSSPNPLMVDHLKNVLEADGIPCLVQNRYSSAAVGELPPTECWPELWVLDDNDAGRGGAIVREALSAPAPVGHWLCAACGERIEAPFTCCWKCGTERGRTGPPRDFGQTREPPREPLLPAGSARYWLLWLLMVLVAFQLLYAYRGG